MDVGFVGLGRMGAAMAARLLAAGWRVTVYNRSPQPALKLAQLGAAVVGRPADVAQEGGLVISMLSDEGAVRDVCLGPAGLLRRLAGGTHLAMTTVSPAFAQAMAQAHADAGCRYLSAPVQGRPPMAAAGQLVAWVSGPLPGEAAQAALAALCQRQVWLGEDARHACAAKLALNFMMFANVELFAEALAYLKGFGADPAVFTQGLTQSAFPGPLFQSIASALLSGDDAARGSDVHLAAKDLRLLLQGASSDDALPVARRVENVYQQAVAQGLGLLDPTAVARVVG